MKTALLITTILLLAGCGYNQSVRCYDKDGKVYFSRDNTSISATIASGVDSVSISGDDGFDKFWHVSGRCVTFRTGEKQ